MNFIYRPEVLDFIEKWEGNVLRAYRDVVGVWTIGVGITDPRYAFEGNVITKEESARLAQEYILKDIQACNRLVRVPTTPDQQTAILSFCFNLGISNFQRSTLLRKLNDGDYMGAYAEFPRWNQAGGRVLRGLVNRRKAEADLFLRGTQQSQPSKESKSAQELEPYKPTPASTNVVPTAPSNTERVNTGTAVTGTAATAAVLQEASNGLAPLAPYSTYITIAFVVLAVLALVWTLKSRKG